MRKKNEAKEKDDDYEKLEIWKNRTKKLEEQQRQGEDDGATKE